MLRDRHEDAIESLRRYLGKGLSADDDIVQDEYKSIRAALEIERSSKISAKEVLLCRDRSSHLRRMLLGMGTQFMQQMGGINALNYYFSIILEENLGMTQLMARVLTGVNATTYCISTGLAFWIIERAGRRFLMLSGLYLQCFAYVMVAIAVGLLAHSPQQVSSNGYFCSYQDHRLTLRSGEQLPSLSCSSITPLSDAHGEW